MSFQELNLSPALLSAVKEQGYTEATPIQAAAIPAIINGQDVIATAQTGTGKTAGFTLPLLQRLLNHEAPHKKTRALILAPTRELAAQVHKSVKTYGRNLPFKATPVFGGVNIRQQITQVRKYKDIIIATPGRLLDLENQKAVDLSAVETLVLDEADRMLDMGFLPDIKRILKLLPKKRQNLLFSATCSGEISKLANQLLHDPKRIEIAPKSKTADNIEQIIYPVDKQRKRELLSFLIGSNNWKQVLVFTRTKHGANRLALQLSEDGLKSDTIHGDKTQAARTRALTNFKKGKARVLVATDVAARGIDIDKLPIVVNFNLPQVAEDYVHRIGRTGRASNTGIALSLVSHDEQKHLADIERLLKKTFKQTVLPGYEPSKPLNTATPAKKKPDGAKKKGRRRFSKSTGPRRSRRGSGKGRPAA